MPIKLTPEQVAKIKEKLGEINRLIQEALTKLKNGDRYGAAKAIGDAIRKKRETFDDIPSPDGIPYDFETWYDFWDHLFDIFWLILINIFTGKTFTGVSGPSCTATTIGLRALLQALNDKISLLEHELQHTTNPARKKLLKKIIGTLKRIRKIVQALCNNKKSLFGPWDRLRIFLLLFLIFIYLKRLFIKYAKLYWGDLITAILAFYIIIDNYLEKAIKALMKLKTNKSDLAEAADYLREAEKQKVELEKVLNQDE